jgi:hypothetical protein
LFGRSGTPFGLQQMKTAQSCDCAGRMQVRLQPDKRWDKAPTYSVFFVDLPSIIVVHFVPSSDVSHLYVYEVGEVSTIV